MPLWQISYISQLTIADIPLNCFAVFAEDLPHLALMRCPVGTQLELLDFKNA